MLRLIVSGGQTGADQAGLRAADAAGIPTGGWAPKGWLTEDGPAPWLAEFGLKEHPKEGYPERTVANVRDSDATLWFGNTDSHGCRVTRAACRKYEKPIFHVSEGVTTPGDVITWMVANNVHTLNIAGNRESKAPGIGNSVERFLHRVFACFEG